MSTIRRSSRSGKFALPSRVPHTGGARPTSGRTYSVKEGHPMAAASQSTKPKPLPLHRQFPHEYDIWAGMKQRCNNEKCREYRYYGERGIRVCRRWSGKGGFKHFIEDMGPQPFRRASVHRIDNDGHYTPGNV